MSSHDIQSAALKSNGSILSTAAVALNTPCVLAREGVCSRTFGRCWQKSGQDLLFEEKHLWKYSYMQPIEEIPLVHCELSSPLLCSCFITPEKERCTVFTTITGQHLFCSTLISTAIFKRFWWRFWQNAYFFGAHTLVKIVVADDPELMNQSGWQ